MSCSHEPGRANLPVGLDARQRVPTGILLTVRARDFFDALPDPT